MREALLQEVNAKGMGKVQGGVQGLLLVRGVGLRVQDVSSVDTHSVVSKQQLGRSTPWDEAMLMLLHYSFLSSLILKGFEVTPTTINISEVRKASSPTSTV